MSRQNCALPEIGEFRLVYRRLQRSVSCRLALVFKAIPFISIELDASCLAGDHGGLPGRCHDQMSIKVMCRGGRRIDCKKVATPVSHKTW